MSYFLKKCCNECKKTVMEAEVPGPLFKMLEDKDKYAKFTQGEHSYLVKETVCEACMTEVMDKLSDILIGTIVIAIMSAREKESTQEEENKIEEFTPNDEVKDILN